MKKWVKYIPGKGSVVGYLNPQHIEAITVKSDGYCVVAWVGDNNYYHLFKGETEAEARAWLEKFMEAQ